MISIVDRAETIEVQRWSEAVAPAFAGEICRIIGGGTVGILKIVEFVQKDLRASPVVVWNMTGCP